MLYKKYADILYSFAISQTKNKELSQDIVQETFLRLWKNRANLDSDGNIQALLFTIARHSIIDSFRKQIKQVEFEEYVKFYEHRLETSSSEEKIYYDEFIERFKRCKSKLSVRECEIFEMSREMNMPVGQIAEALKLSPQTVKNYITSSLKVFRQSLLKEQY